LRFVVERNSDLLSDVQAVTSVWGVAFDLIGDRERRPVDLQKDAFDQAVTGDQCRERTEVNEDAADSSGTTPENEPLDPAMIAVTRHQRTVDEEAGGWGNGIRHSLLSIRMSAAQVARKGFRFARATKAIRPEPPLTPGVAPSSVRSHTWLVLA